VPVVPASDRRLIRVHASFNNSEVDYGCSIFFSEAEIKSATYLGINTKFEIFDAGYYTGKNADALLGAI